MTRIVSVFFAAVAFLLVVYWVVPGAAPPAMVAATPVTVAPPAAVRPAEQARAVQPALAPVAAAPAPASPVPVKAAARAASTCDGDPIKCMLEGRNAVSDPTDVTGSIVPAPRKVSLQSGGKPAAKLTR